MISNLRAIRDLTSLLKAHGVAESVVSPGSRNAPITNSLFFTSEIRTTVVVDERCAGFFALGMARSGSKPVSLVCTSGSALLNYGPALAEAFYAQIPLIVISADRPKERIDQGEGQSIRQPGALGNVVKGTFELTHELNDDRVARQNFRIVNEALALAMSLPRGPVHINVPLREELYEMNEGKLLEAMPIESIHPSLSVSTGILAKLTNEFLEKKKVLILTGMLEGGEILEKELARLAKSDSVLVMTESISNLHNPLFVGCTDRLISTFTEKEKHHFAPDLIVTVGHSIVSGKIKSLLRSYSGVEHWHIGHEGMVDTFECLSKSIGCIPEVFFSAMLRTADNPGSSSYGNYFREKNRLLAKIQKAFLPRIPFCDLKAFEIILHHLPESETLELGNSSVVRYAQLFDLKQGIMTYSNRGVSGIDGCTSTAAGAAFLSGKSTTFISGDLSFLYDSNALWSVPQVNNLKMIVINNGGGNIFRIIDGPEKYPSAEANFVAKHNKRIRPLVEAHGIKCLEANDAESLENALSLLRSFDGPAVLEVLTTDELNPKILKEYFEHLKMKSNEQ